MAQEAALWTSGLNPDQGCMLLYKASGPNVSPLTLAQKKVQNPGTKDGAL